MSKNVEKRAQIVRMLSDFRVLGLISAPLYEVVQLSLLLESFNILSAYFVCFRTLCASVAR